jgi:2-iminoacetate synthase
MTTFHDTLLNYNWDEVTRSIYAKTSKDVKDALSTNSTGLEGFMALVSPAADRYLEEMAVISHNITRRRFGNTIQLYVPIYLSNFCENSCVYCGFSAKNKIERKVLTIDELKLELEIIKSNPFQHLLIVTGESATKAGVEYLSKAIETARQLFNQVSVEVQPLNAKEYQALIESGLHGVYVYQETYCAHTYANYHPKGKKADFRYRLETPDRIGLAGAHKIGLGSLIGLEDWRTEAFFTALHVAYLRKKYWQTKLSVSFPRLRPYAGQGYQPSHPCTERQLLQLICAYRLFDADLELSLSTRESAYFRDNAFPLGITAMSAGSKTGPGGYGGNNALEQFAIHDDRTPQQVAQAITEKGFEPIWKDWETSLQLPTLTKADTHAAPTLY